MTQFFAAALLVLFIGCLLVALFSRGSTTRLKQQVEQHDVEMKIFAEAEKHKEIVREATREEQKKIEGMSNAELAGALNDIIRRHK